MEVSTHRSCAAFVLLGAAFSCGGDGKPNEPPAPQGHAITGSSNVETTVLLSGPTEASTRTRPFPFNYAFTGLADGTYIVSPQLERGLYMNPRRRRSEEHTSELQSRSDLVCRLLL